MQEGRHTQLGVDHVNNAAQPGKLLSHSTRTLLRPLEMLPDDVESSENQTKKNVSDDNFGLTIRDERDQISSKILGAFEGWTGTTKFTLENGQVWQQVSFGVLRVKMNNPNIIIKSSILSDTYTLKIEGLNSSIRVKRIK